jgi:hypothetical protein
MISGPLLTNSIGCPFDHNDITPVGPFLGTLSRSAQGDHGEEQAIDKRLCIWPPFLG